MALLFAGRACTNGDDMAFSFFGNQDLYPLCHMGWGGLVDGLLKARILPGLCVSVNNLF